MVTPSANRLRGVISLRCQSCSHKQSKTLQNAHFDFGLINIRAVSLDSQQKCHTGIGEGLVALLTNFHNWQIVIRNNNEFCKSISPLRDCFFHALTRFKLKTESANQHSNKFYYSISWGVYFIDMTTAEGQETNSCPILKRTKKTENKKD